jgi:hypothetical protein
MEPTDLLSTDPDLNEIHGLPSCPVCGEQFLLISDQWRCQRCHFWLCDSCDGLGRPAEET